VGARFRRLCEVSVFVKFILLTMYHPV
jgi:hypothetical protein